MADPTSGPDIALVQRIIDGRWRHADAARRACQTDSWRSFLMESPQAPKRPRFNELGTKAIYRAHTRCVERATEMFAGPRTVSVQVVPTWSGDNEVENPRDDCWFETHAIKVDDGTLAGLETGPVDKDADPSLSAPVRCDTRLWEVGVVVRSRSYAPGVELELRDGDYAVLRSDILEVLSVHVSTGHRPAPRPTIEVPPFCCWTEARVLGLDETLEEELRALSITVDDEGNIIERPSR